MILGCDPGLSGAFALIDLSAVRPVVLDLLDVPTVSEGPKRRIHVSELSHWLKQHSASIDVCYIERAQAFPQTGVSSAFLYGRTVGYLEATILCSGIRLKTVVPAVWKKHFNLLHADNKSASIEKAKTVKNAGTFLTLAKHHNRAEAILIAVYGAFRETQ